MTHATQTLFVLTGCTAVGKTDLSLQWALANDAEIVSCDSLLFYRGMDIGAAKPTVEERSRVRHHLIDIKKASERMDIAEYLERAIAAIDDIHSRGKRVLVTGGSGFYLKSFFSPVVDAVVVSEETRRQVAAIEKSSGLVGMQEALAELDPNFSDQVDTLNPRRVVRALERSMETGMSLKELKDAFNAQSNRLIELPKQLTILERDKEALDVRIEQRVKRMLEAGLIDEVKRLIAEGFESNRSGSGSIGYRETIAYLNGEYDGDVLKQTIATHTRQLAKKQRTWFRTQLPEGRSVVLSEEQSIRVDSLFQSKRGDEG